MKGGRLRAMIQYVLKHGEAPIVEAVDFGVLSTEAILERSVIEVTDTAVYHRGVPVMKGINDMRMVRATI